MGIISKALAALVILGIAALLIDGYGDARYNSGWQAATTEQRAEADKIAKNAADEKAASDRRLATLQAKLDDTMDKLNKRKEAALLHDETYHAFRKTPIHRVTRCRIWSELCDKDASGDRVRTP